MEQDGSPDTPFIPDSQRPFVWSRSGNPVEDQRIDRMANRWIQGEIDDRQLAREIHTALKQGVGRVLGEIARSDFGEFAKAVKLGSMFQILLGVVVYCMTQKEINTPEKRREAFAVIGEKFGLNSQSTNDPGWLKRIHQSDVGYPDITERMRTLARQWIDGEIDHKEFDLLTTLATKEAEKRKFAARGGPVEGQLDASAAHIHACIMANLLQPTADYVEAQKFDLPQQREASLNRMEQALDASRRR